MKKILSFISILLILFVSCNSDPYITEEFKEEESTSIQIPENISADLANYANKLFSILNQKVNADTIDSNELENYIGITSYEYIDVIENDTTIHTISLLGNEYTKDKKFNIEINSIGTYSDYAWKIENNKLYINKALLVLNNLFGYIGYIGNQEINYSVYNIDQVKDIEISAVKFQNETEKNELKKTETGYDVTISDNTNPLLLKPDYEQKDSDIFCYIDSDSSNIGISKTPTIYAYQTKDNITDWKEYEISREYKIINKNNECNGKFNINISLSPNLKPYLIEIAARVLSSFNAESLCEDLLIASESDSMKDTGKGTTENGLVVEIQEYSSLQGSLLSAKLAQLTGKTDKYPMEINTSLSVGSETGYTHGFTNEDISLKGILEFSLTGLLHAKGNVKAAYSKYAVSASELVFIIEDREYTVSFSNLVGEIDFVADPRTDLSVDFTINPESLTAPEKSDSIIAINGIDIDYSDIFTSLSPEQG